MSEEVLSRWDSAQWDLQDGNNPDILTGDRASKIRTYPGILFTLCSSFKNLSLLISKHIVLEIVLLGSSVVFVFVFFSTIVHLGFGS